MDGLKLRIEYPESETISVILILEKDRNFMLILLLVIGSHPLFPGAQKGGT